MIVEVEKSANSGKLKMKEKLSYAAGDLASNIVFQGLSLLILFYWTEKAGISAAAAGVILLISRTFDGFTDVIFGIIVDKTKSKHGKARPYLLWLSLPLALSLTITFWSPNTSSNMVNIMYAFITYNLTMIIYTGINIPYGVLSAKMTNDQQERGVLSILRGAGAMIAILLVSVVAPVLSENIGYTLTFLVLGLVGAMFFFITFKGTKERVGADENSDNVPLKVGVKSLFKNRPWILLLIAGCVSFISFTCRMATTAYFAQYNLGDPKYVGILSIISLPGMIVGMLASVPLYKKFGKVKSCIYTSVLLAIITIPFYFFIRIDKSLPLIVAYLIVSGAIMGVSQSGFFAMVADSIEYGEWKTGVRVEGLTYSAASVGTKVGGGIGAAIVGGLLGLAGYKAGLDVQSTDVNIMIEWLYLWIPSIGCLIFAIIMMFNDVDKKYPQIMEDLAKRKER
ncbi:MFS transporter [Clostridium hydrogeniformans]|uniref:MFS transporter n=1 Tax=Clostridium hydrogeniformans TaxID=349933 RepID=UPI000482E9D9|nr:glycoside-pentoside-hexuronide (GPH):cation symporter [Clostridium hydrogeniformans]